MKFDLKKPCNNCPFTHTSMKGWLGEARAEEIIESLLVRDESFPCHKTIDYDRMDDDDEDDSWVPTGEEQHCAGATIMLLKMEMPNQMMRIMGRLGYLKEENIDMDAPVFDDDHDFIEHHTQ